jgi:anti-sigma B factor antagonist
MSDSLVIERTATYGRVVVLHVIGRLDVKTAPELRSRGAEVAEEGRNLILNLSGVTFLGSSGLGALLSLHEEFQEQAGEVRIVDPSEAATSVMRLISLDQLLAIDPDEASALKAMQAA